MSSNISSGGGNSFANRFNQYAFQHNTHKGRLQSGDGLSQTELLEVANDEKIPADVRQMARLFLAQDDLFTQASQLSQDGIRGLKLSKKDIELFAAQNPETIAQLETALNATQNTTSGTSTTDNATTSPSSTTTNNNTWDPFSNSGWSQMFGNWSPQQAQSFMTYMYLMGLNTGNFNNLDTLMGPLRQLMSPSSNTQTSAESTLPETDTTSV